MHIIRKLFLPSAVEEAADVEEATDAAGREMEHRGEMERPTGDEDKCPQEETWDNVADVPGNKR